MHWNASSPVRRVASSSGLAIVAEARRKRGEVPYAAAMRRRRRMTFATCEPKTPRYTWASSITTTARLANRSDHAAWLGRIPTWSMSGLVRTTLARLRICPRASRGVSPS